jgi:hypothetical protein
MLRFTTGVISVLTTITLTACGGSSTLTAPTVTPAPAPVVAPIAAVTIFSINSSALSVVGGSPMIGSVTLTGAAPASGASVVLSASAPLTVPATVMIPAGQATATFPIATRAVGVSTTGTVNGSYGGTSVSLVLSVTQPTGAIARFGVSGRTESETCALTNGGATLECTFDGSTSSAPGTIVAWEWTYGVATTITQTTSGPVLTMPAVTCGFIPPAPMPPGENAFRMTVTLVVRDNLGNVSTAFSNSDVRLFPAGTCGF